MDAEFRNELRDTNERNWERFRAELARTAAELRTEIAGVRTDVRGEIGALRTEMHASLESHMRWTIALWVTTLIAIAGLKFL